MGSWRPLLVDLVGDRDNFSGWQFDNFPLLLILCKRLLYTWSDFLIRCLYCTTLSKRKAKLRCVRTSSRKREPMGFNSRKRPLNLCILGGRFQGDSTVFQKAPSHFYERSVHPPPPREFRGGVIWPTMLYCVPRPLTKIILVPVCWWNSSSLILWQDPLKATKIM